MEIIKSSEELAKLVDADQDLCFPNEDVQIAFQLQKNWQLGKRQIRNVYCRNLYLMNGNERFDFVGGRNFYGLDFFGLDFCGSDFNGRDFYGRDFLGHNFNGRNFRGVDFLANNFNGRNFDGEDFLGHIFYGLDFKGYNFNGNIFNGRDFKGNHIYCDDFNGRKIEAKEISFYHILNYKTCNCNNIKKRTYPLNEPYIQEEPIYLEANK